MKDLRGNCDQYYKTYVKCVNYSFYCFHALLCVFRFINNVEEMSEFACKARFFFALTVEIVNCIVVAETHAHLLLPTTDGVMEHTFVIQQKVLLGRFHT